MATTVNGIAPRLACTERQAEEVLTALRGLFHEPVGDEAFRFQRGVIALRSVLTYLRFHAELATWQGEMDKARNYNEAARLIIGVLNWYFKGVA